MLTFALGVSTILALAWSWRVWRQVQGGIASFAGGAEVERATSRRVYWMVVSGHCVVLLLWLLATAAFAILMVHVRMNAN
jgi:hypothetical protein